MPIDLDLKGAAYAALFVTMGVNAFSNSLFEISSSVFVGLALLAFLKDRQMRVLSGWFLVLLALYVAVNAASLAWSAFPGESLKGVFRVLRQALLCLAVVYVLDSESRTRKIFFWLAAVAFVIGIDALIQGMTGTELMRQRQMTPFYVTLKRLTGPFNHANNFSAYLTLVFFVFLGAVCRMNRFLSLKQRLFFWTGLAVVSYSLFATYSRGAWIVVVLVCGLYALATRNKRLAGGVVLLVAWMVFFPPPFVKMRLESLFSWKEGTVYERKELWAESLRMIRERPLLGHGVNTYARVEPRFESEKFYIDNQYAHNGYLQMAAEIGLVGLAAFLSFLGYFLCSSGAVFCRAPSFLGAAGFSLLTGIAAFLLHSSTDTNLHSLLLVNFLWIAIGIVWAARSSLLRGGAS